MFRKGTKTAKFRARVEFRGNGENGKMGTILGHIKMERTGERED